MAANRLSQSGAAWAQIFEVYNSGTYNNQWMVVDYKQVAAGHCVIMYSMAKKLTGLSYLSIKLNSYDLLDFLSPKASVPY